MSRSWGSAEHVEHAAWLQCTSLTCRKRRRFQSSGPAQKGSLRRNAGQVAARRSARKQCAALFSHPRSASSFCPAFVCAALPAHPPARLPTPTLPPVLNTHSSSACHSPVRPMLFARKLRGGGKGATRRPTFANAFKNQSPMSDSSTSSVPPDSCRNSCKQKDTPKIHRDRDRATQTISDACL